MKILVSRDAVQGDRYDDFQFTADGEPLSFPVVVCEGVDLDGEAHAQRCGCERSFTGVESAKGTTLAVVEDRAEDDVRARLEAGALLASWSEVSDDAAELFWEELTNIAEDLEATPVGTRVRVKNTPSSNRLIFEE